MLSLKNIRVRSLDVDFHELSWEIENTSEDVYDYTFQIFRSESVEGPFDVISAPFEDVYVFVDNSLRHRNEIRRYEYRIRVAQKSTSEYVEFGPASLEPEPDIYAEEIRRHIQLLMMEHAGRRVWVLPKRTFGQRCECWDQTMNKRVRSGCRTCWDTGFTRGYLSPIEAWIQIDPTSKNEVTTQMGKQQSQNTRARMAYYPPMKPGDLLVEGENRRWRVVNVTGTEKGRAVVHQELSIHEIPSMDIEYAIPLVLDKALRDMRFSPDRNYSNPFNLDAFTDEEVQALRESIR